MTIDEMIAVLQAAKEGKTIEFRNPINLGSNWIIAKAPAWDFASYDYRAKPEPMELKVWVSQNGVTQIQISEYATESYDDAGGER